MSLPRLVPDLTVYMSNTTGVLLKAGTAYHSRAPDSTPVSWWDPEWTIQRNLQQDKDKQSKNTTQYVLDTTIPKQTQIM
jgi:hypothetical protein